MAHTFLPTVEHARCRDHGAARESARVGLVALFLLLGAHRAMGDTRARVLDTFPSGSAVTLSRNQYFYLRLHYHADHPVGLWIRPYFQGRPVDAGTSPSMTYSGDGDALAWFFLLDPEAQVDEVRIVAGDGSPKGTSVVATYPVQVAGSVRSAAQAPLPDWVVRLQAREARARQEAYARSTAAPLASREVPVFEGFMSVAATLGLLAVAWPAWGLWRWRGGWRAAAAVPAALMLLGALRIILGAAVDPTSHNLWPFEWLRMGALSVAIMLALAVLRRVNGRREAP